MEYMEKVLGIKVTRSKWYGENKLPYYLLDRYNFELASMDGITALIVKPKGELDPIGAIRKHIKRLSGEISCPVVFELNTITRQRKKSFIEARIPFVVSGKQIYLPFMGMLLLEKCDGEQNLNMPSKLQPSSQMLLFAFLHGKGAPVQMSRMAEQLHFSAMTISRAAVQLTEIGLLQKKSGWKSAAVSFGIDAGRNIPEGRAVFTVTGKKDDLHSQKPKACRHVCGRAYGSGGADNAESTCNGNSGKRLSGEGISG